MLEQELAPLEAQIGNVRQKHEALEGQLRAVEAELETFSADRRRIDALRDACDALDKLGELKADELFWEGIPEAKDTAGHLERARGRVARFEAEISGILEKQQSLRKQINQCLDELDILDEDVRYAYAREERRKEEFVVEREISPVPYHEIIMPWSREAESERRFRRAALVALFMCFVFSATFSLINVPALVRPALVVVPERLVSLLKREAAKPAPVRKPLSGKQNQGEPKQEPKPRQYEPEVASASGGAPAVREKAVGMLAFKDAFADLVNETPVAKLGAEAPLSNESPRVKGQAVARSLVSIQAGGGGSGGIGGAGVSRGIGNGNVGRLGGGGGAGGGAGFVRVASAIASLEESSRPLSDGLASGRTDEEIQIVFDRYKAALYRIYNKELRKAPALRGKILMRISIETSGSVSLCKVESTDLASAELVAEIVERIKRFNFGPKEGAQKVTILYPIDFLPAG